MNPTVGRIVHFVQNGNHFAAIITWVWPQERVNLFVFPSGSIRPFVFPSGSIRPVPGAVDSENVAHTVDHDEACGEWTWHWPERD